MRKCLHEKGLFRPMRKGRIGAKVLLLLMLLMAWQGAAASNYLNASRATLSSQLAEGGYVQLRIPVYESDGYDERVTDGTLYVTPAGGERQLVLKFRSSDGDWQATSKDYWWFKSRVHLGTALVQENDKKWVKFGTDDYTVNVSPIKEDDNEVTVAYYRWYIPEELVGKELTFQLDMWCDYNEDAYNAILSSQTFAPVAGGNYSTPALSFAPSGNAGKYTVTYSGVNNPKEGSKISWDASSATASTATSGTKEYDVKDTKQTSKFTYLYYVHEYGVYARKEVSLELPPFRQAKDVEVTNIANGATLISWKTDDSDDSNDYRGGYFEVQRSKDAGFSSNNTFTVGTIAFEKDKHEYSLTDETGSLNLNGKIYYRIRRDAVTQWSWDFVKTGEITKSVSHRFISSATVQRLDWSGDQSAKISWTLDEHTNDKVWTDGATIRIKQIKDDGRGTILSSLITVSEQDLENGYYIDELNSSCMKYTYTIYVVPGNASFKEQTELPVELDGDDIIPSVLGKVESLKVSKGYFSDYASLKWTTDGKPIDRFNILRRPYEAGTNGEWDNVDQMEGGSQTSYVYADDKALPGVMYEYMVQASTICAGKEITNDSNKENGFRSPTGTVSGKITFSYGDAVSGVVVRLGGGERKGSSLSFAGNASSYASTDAAISLPENFTVQAWVNPEVDGMLVNSGIYQLKLNDGKPAFTANGGTDWVVGDTILKRGTFSHLTAVYSTTGRWTIYAGEKQVASLDSRAAGTRSNAKVELGKGFKGNIDEVRLWKKALDTTEIKQTYNRLLLGNEPDLMAYWRFDDKTDKEFYDLSHVSTTYNENHGTLQGTAAYSDKTPTDQELALMGVTGTDGVYVISGIPYVGNGTTYRLTPYYPNHTFNPASSDVTIGQTATSISGMNFADNSAIEIDGYVFYENSSIPVNGVSFKINGQTVLDGNGGIITSDSNGKFKFSVPTGSQRVQAVLANHVFKNDGLLLNDQGNNQNYQQPMSNLRFWDQTKVKLIGRVAGGTVEEAKPLGFSLSKNNLGDDALITIELEGYEGQPEIVDTDASTYPSGVENIDSLQTHWDGEHQNRVSYRQYQITINPDPETGEYEAYLFPAQYKVTGVSVNGYDPFLKANQILDMRNVFHTQISEYTPKEGTTHEVSYNDSWNLIYRTPEPSLTFKQGNQSGYTTDYFGLKEWVLPDPEGGKPDTLDLYDEKDGTYLFDAPVYEEGNSGLVLKATEDYYYNNIREGEGIKVDHVNVRNGTVKISNEFITISEPVRVKLDENGVGYYTLEMKEEGFTSNKLKKIELSLLVADETGKEKEYGKGQISAYLLGDRSGGKNFVTEGPSRLLNILRDPPGSHSYSWWESGQSYTFYNETGRGFTNIGSEQAKVLIGQKVTTGTGLGAFIVQESDIVNSATAQIQHEEATNNPHATTTSVTLNSRYQTSDDPLLVGSSGDVFIGMSNNIFYGPADCIEIMDKKTYDLAGGQQPEIYITKVKDGNTYYICKSKKMNVSMEASTLFSYTQSYIENILLPNLEELRNSLLSYGITEAAAKNVANQTKKRVYLSLIEPGEDGFGEDNSDGEDDSYKVIFPDGYEVEKIDPADLKLPEYSNGSSFLDPDNLYQGNPDEVYTYNQIIKDWVRLLKQNEDEKLEAFKEPKLENYSFTGGSPVEYAEQFSSAKEDGYSYSFMAAAGAIAEIGFTINGAGVRTTIDNVFGGTGSDERSAESEDSYSSGFVLADEGDFDYLSVDVYRSAPVDTAFKKVWNDRYEKLEDEFGEEGHTLPKNVSYGNFVFSVKGGATACPYEGEEYTKYQDNQQKLLNEATMQIERPTLNVEKAVITNIPSDKAAVYDLTLYNDSYVTGTTAIFTIAILDAANQKGAKFSIDGVPLGEGRGIEVPYGEVMHKELEVRRGSEYDYENLALVLKSQCQSDPTDFQADIADTVYISAHFIPSSSDINIKTPTDKWTLNTQSSLDSTSGKYYMPLTIDGFDVNFTGFDHIEIQYKPSSGSDKDWTNICSFFNDSVLYKAASGEKAMIEGATISTRFYGAEDQKYDIRAVTFSKVGNEFVTKSSPVISGVKDTKRPVTFGNIQPADGVLGIEDEIRLNFNEEIAEGYMTDVKNFQVTAVRNGSNGDHSTSLTFNGTSSYLATQAERNLEDKDVSVEMWVLPSALGQQMTLFSHGTTTNPLELSIGADNSIQVSVGGKTYSSKPQNFKTTDWAHIAMSYKASNHQLSAYFGGIEVIAGVQTSEPNKSMGPMQFGRSVRGDNYFAGKMHEARVWNKVVSSSDIMANKLTIYTGQEAGMLAYYPMNDGKGDRVTDKAQGATAWVYGADWSMLEGLSVAFKGDTLMAINTSKLALTDEQDYTLEFWFKAAPGQKDAALVSNGKGIGEENNTNHNKVFVGFVDNKLVFRNNGHEEVLSGEWDDDSWHHFAIAVNRNAGNAQIFLDGALNSYFDAGKLGGFSGTRLYLGARRWTGTRQMVDSTNMYLKGQVDELRLWNMALPSKVIKKNYNVCPKGTEMGLMLYMPFHKYITNSANIREMVFSGEDLVTDSTLVTEGSRLASEEKAPVRAKGPEVSIPFTFVVNKDALVINLMDTPEALEKTTVNFTVKDVSDLNGNLMQSPVNWSAYINRNQLKWSQPSVTKEKKLYAPMTFMVDVENQGGTEKNFTIEGLPAWLKAEPEYGTIDPLGRQTILFTVDEGTNVGRYDEVVYVKGDNNVSEALPVTLKVFDEQPDWTVDPADFKYNMNIYGKLRVNKLFSTDAEDMIAVFDGGRCVGVANNQYADKNDMWYVFLTVYGNEASGSDNLNFRVWDASTGTVYDAYCDSTVMPDKKTGIRFRSDSIIGTASTPVVFDAEERVVQNINLVEGWNWVSFNVKSDVSDLTTVFRNSMMVGDEQVKDEAMGSFAAYYKEGKEWLGDNIVFDNKHMYLIQSSVAQKLSVSGIAIKEKADLTIPVAPKRWNYISYLPMTNLPIAEALSGYNAKEGDIIKSQNTFSMYGVKTGWLGNLTYMEPGKGYMLLNNGDTTSLVYPDMMGGSDLRSSGLLTRSGGAMTAEATFTDTRFDANMSVVATVAESLPVYAGDKLQAYVGGELRGEALLTEDPYDGRPLYFVSIGGDQNEAVSFALERGGEIIAETSPMFDYRVNNVQGSIEQPVILDFVNDLQISVYPNPFERELNFVMNTEAGDKVGIYLYTMAGQMIHRHTETSANGGYLHYRWECYEGLARTVYMAVVVVNGQKHVYKVKRK